MNLQSGCELQGSMCHRVQVIYSVTTMVVGDCCHMAPDSLWLYLFLDIVQRSVCSCSLWDRWQPIKSESMPCVACAACLFLSVLMIVAKAVISSATMRYGFVPLVSLFVVTISTLGTQTVFSPKLLLRIFLRSCS